MKTFFYKLLLLAGALCVFAAQSYSQEIFKGKYLGKKPPGLTRELFDQGAIAGPNAFNFSFSPDGKELFFSYRTGTEEKPDPWYTMMYMKQVDGVWTKAEVAFFSGKSSDVDITFAPDGKRCYFISDRHDPEDSDVYYIEKIDGEWSDPIRIKGDVNVKDGDEMHASISRDGTFVFRSTRPGGYGDNDLYLADYVEGEFINVRNMGPGINTDLLESDCFIAQDGSYIVYNAIRRENNMKPNIWVTFRLEDGSWSEGIPLGSEVNSPDGTIGSTITPDGKYLIYSARYGDVRGRYWISTDVVKKLKLKFLEGDYLGQYKPGMKLQKFADGIVSSKFREHSSITISPKGDEIIFTRQDEKNDIYISKMKDGKWSLPEPTTFNSSFLDDGASFTPDGNRIYFGSRRPDNAGGEELEQTEIWYVDRTENGFGEPVKMGEPINSESSDGYPCIAANGNMYFHSTRNTNEKDANIYKAVFKNGNFENVIKLNATINTDTYQAAPYIAPDESFIIYFSIDLNKQPFQPDLLLSFSIGDNEWTKPISLAKKLNLKANDLIMAKLSPDGKYLFILDQGDVFWIDSDFLNDLKPK